MFKIVFGKIEFESVMMQIYFSTLLKKTVSNIFYVETSKKSNFIVIFFI